MTLLRWIGLFVVAFAVLFFLLVWSLPMTLPLGLALAGVSNVTFNAIDVGLRRVRIDALAIGKSQPQKVAAIEARYSLPGLIKGRIDYIRIDGLVVQAAYVDGAVSFGDEIDAHVDGRRSGDNGPIELAPLLMTDNLLIQNSRIQIETSSGAFSLPFDGRASLIPDRLQVHLDVPSAALTAKGLSKFQGKVQLSAAVMLDDQLRPVAIEGGNVVVDLKDIGLDPIALDDGRLELALDGPLDRLKGSLTLDLNGLTASLGKAEVRGIKMQRVLDVALNDSVLEVTARTESPKVSVDQVLVADRDNPILESGWFTIQWPRRDKPWLRLDLEDQSVALDWKLEVDPVRIGLPAGRSWARIEDLAVTLIGGPLGIHHGNVAIRDGRVDLPMANLAFIGIDSDIRLGKLGAAVDDPIPLAVRAVRPLDEPRLFAPLRLDMNIKPETSRLDVDGTLKMASQQNAVLDFRGRHDLAGDRGELDLELAKITFGAGQLQPKDLSPILDGVIDRAEGGIALDGRITWEDERLTSDVALLIDELGFAIGPARLSRINSVIRFDGVAPLSTPSDQLLSVGLLDVGLPLIDGLVSMQLQPDGQLAVDRLTWRLADGRIRAEPFTFGSDVQDLTLMLKAEQLDLNELLKLTPLDDLTGEGRIDGTLPLTIGEAAAIEGGKLAATGPGVLRYTPSTMPGVLQAGGESVRLMLQALENFRYDALKITLDGRTDGANAIGLHLKGANPDLYDSHPVEFNLNLEGNLANLVQANLENYQIPDRIRERLQGFRR